MSQKILMAGRYEIKNIFRTMPCLCVLHFPVEFKFFYSIAVVLALKKRLQRATLGLKLHLWLQGMLRITLKRASVSKANKPRKISS